MGELQEKADDHDIEENDEKARNSATSFFAGKRTGRVCHAGPLGLGRKPALVGFDVRLQILDLLVAIGRVQRERLHDHGGKPVGNALARAMGEHEMRGRVRRFSRRQAFPHFSSRLVRKLDGGEIVLVTIFSTTS